MPSDAPLDLRDAGQRNGFSAAAVSSMVQSLRAGHGRMAQIDHPEFGGRGQWMRGGMIMVSDIFDSALKARIGRLCEELSLFIAKESDAPDSAGTNSDPAIVVSAAPAGNDNWWPSDLGRADQTGSQNNMRYAYFGSARRLAIDTGGEVSVYDTRDHHISGVAQQQGAGDALAFSSQHGIVDLATLPIVAANGPQPAPDIVSTIEKLALLHADGILSEAEFAAKKSELLSRL